MVEITSVISAPGGKFAENYADSIAVTPDRLYVRENYGYSVFGHGLTPQRSITVDIEGMPGYSKIGDGFQTISNVGASPDGFRLVVGYKQDLHGTLVFAPRWGGDHRAPDNKLIGEFSPPNCLGGVTVVKNGATYTAFSLQGGGLSYVDVTAASLGKLKPRRLAAGRNAQGLITVGERAAYVDDGDLVLVKTNGAQQRLPMTAVTLASEGDVLLIGVERGMERLGMDIVVLPETPRAICLLRSVAYAVVTVDGAQHLYREGERIFTFPPETWPVVQLRGFDQQLYCATTQRILVVRVA